MTVAARHTARAVDGERQRAAAVVVDPTPRARRASSTGPIGRTRACASPSKRTGPSASAASGGRNRITVPASPQSTRRRPATSPGVTSQSAESSVVRVVLDGGAEGDAGRAAISRVSRERSGARSREGPSARAASTR